MTTKAKKVRYKNKRKGLQIIYDENGSKKELVPGATIFLDPEWAGRYRCLERVISDKAGPGRPPKSQNNEE